MPMRHKRIKSQPPPPDAYDGKPYERFHFDEYGMWDKDEPNPLQGMEREIIATAVITVFLIAVAIIATILMCKIYTP